MKSIYKSDYEMNYPYYELWREVISEYLNETKCFELHIWNEETGLIELALKYGDLKTSDWGYGKIVCGKVTEEFKSMILDSSDEREEDPLVKMTPFFNIFLDDKYQSCHWGTEIHIM